MMYQNIVIEEDFVENIDLLGQYPLFLGIESASWSLAQFQEAAHNAKALGCTSLLVKIADGGNVWFAGIGGWQKVVDAINPIIKAVPYTYCYGDKFGAEGTEDAILAAAMKHSGIVVADMEAEFNGHPDWASAVAKALVPIAGVFGVTTWADPELQSWMPVLAALKPCVNFWLPQVYSDFLANDYHARFDQFGLPYYPILNLGVLAGTTNNILQIAKNAHSTIIGFWEYQAAIGSYASTVKEIIALKGQNTMGVPQGWHDDGSILTAPNGITVKLGFREYVLNHNWDPANIPLRKEESCDPIEEGFTQNPSGGSRQPFLYEELGYTTARGVYRIGIGNELLAVRSDRDHIKAQLSELQKLVGATNLQQINTLAAQIVKFSQVQ